MINNQQEVGVDAHNWVEDDRREAGKERRRHIEELALEAKLMSQQITTHIADEDRLFKSIRAIIGIFALVCSILSSLLGWIYLDGRAQQQATNIEFRVALAEHSAQINRTLTLMEVAAEINKRQQHEIDSMLIGNRRKP